MKKAKKSNEKFSLLEDSNSEVKNQKKNRIFGIFLLAALNIVSLSSCSSQLKTAEKDFNQAINERINNPETINKFGVPRVEKYSFLNVEFNNEDLKSYVDISGIAKFDNGKQGYVNSGIYIDKSEFKDVTEKTKTESILNILTNNIKNNTFDHLEILPVENLKKLSNAVARSMESPIEEFQYNDGMLYGLSAPIINHEEGYAVFQTKTYMKYRKTVVTPTPGYIGADADGNPKFGIVLVTSFYYEHYDHTTNIYVKANENELKAMESDPALTYSKFVDLYNSKDKNKDIVIQSVSVKEQQENANNYKNGKGKIVTNETKPFNL